MHGSGFDVFTGPHFLVGLLVLGGLLSLAVRYWPERKPPLPPDFGGGVWDSREDSDEDEQC